MTLTPDQLATLLASWMERAASAEVCAKRFDANSDDSALAYASRTERRVWITCARELIAAVMGTVP